MLILLFSIVSSTSIILNGKGALQCFNQRVELNSEISMAYVVSGLKEQYILVSIADSQGRLVYTSTPNTREGKFDGKAPQSGIYRLCFQSATNGVNSVSFEFFLQLGQQEEKIATQDEINPIRTSFRKLSRNLDTVYRNIQFYERREKIHRDLAEVTCDRILFGGILKMVGLALVSVGQIWVMKGFFSNRSVNAV